MAGDKSTADEMQDLEQARQRIRTLEKGMDEAIKILLQRDEQLTAAERRIGELQQQIESLSQATD